MVYDTILGVAYGTMTLLDGPLRRGGDTGCLYMVEFDSGWVKIGHTTDWPARHHRLVTDFGTQYGWTITRHWQSAQVSAIKQPGTRRPPPAPGPRAPTRTACPSVRARRRAQRPTPRPWPGHQRPRGIRDLPRPGVRGPRRLRRRPRLLHPGHSPSAPVDLPAGTCHQRRSQTRRVAPRRNLPNRCGAALLVSPELVCSASSPATRCLTGARGTITGPRWPRSKPTMNIARLRVRNRNVRRSVSRSAGCGLGDRG